MDCLQLARRLANKVNSKATLSPTSTKQVTLHYSPSLLEENSSDCEDNPYNEIWEKRNPHIKTKQHPPISYVFEDLVYKKYFKKFLFERKMSHILDFIDFAKDYEKSYPVCPEKQVRMHRQVIEKLGTLPSHLIKVSASASDDMSIVSKKSFRSCIEALLVNINEREYKSFIQSDHYIKWTLKYVNIQ